MLPTVLADAHSTLTSEHFSYLKTLNRISASFVWPGIRTFIKQFLHNCDVCQRSKNETLRPSRLLQPLPIP